MTTSNHAKLQSSEGIVCLYCSDLLTIKGSTFIPPKVAPDYIRYEEYENYQTPDEWEYQNHALCKCGNVGIISDFDDHLHIYVDDIRTCQRAFLFHTGDYKEINRELREPFSKAGYVNYHSVRSSPIKFSPVRPYNPYSRITKTRYDKRLMAAMDRYKLHTSDGKQDFQRTALTNPLIITHKDS